MSAPGVVDPDFRTTDLECAEREFVAAMDSIQEYMKLQAKLQDQLKQGLLSLARAKYSMGPIGQAQYDMGMKASVRVAVNGTEAPNAYADAGTADSRSCSGRRYSFTLQRGPATAGRQQPQSTTSGAAAAGDSDVHSGPDGVTASATVGTATVAVAASAVGRESHDSRGGAVPQRGPSGNSSAAATATPPAGGLNTPVALEFSDDEDGDEEEEGEEGLREANEFLRRMRMQTAEASGGSSGCGGGGRDENTAGQQRPSVRRRRGGRGGGGGGEGARAPLHWFGRVLVPPAVKQAQAQFSAALETCLLLTNTAQRLAPEAPATAASRGEGGGGGRDGVSVSGPA